jgi:hypothetical protein
VHVIRCRLGLGLILAEVWTNESSRREAALSIRERESICKLRELGTPQFEIDTKSRDAVSHSAGPNSIGRVTNQTRAHDISVRNRVFDCDRHGEWLRDRWFFDSNATVRRAQFQRRSAAATSSTPTKEECDKCQGPWAVHGIEPVESCICRTSDGGEREAAKRLCID